jgi:hypothetical protein
MEAIRFSETSVRTRATRRNIAKDAILHVSHCSGPSQETGLRDSVCRPGGGAQGSIRRASVHTLSRVCGRGAWASELVWKRWVPKPR